jgi:hypothetical protein
MSGVNFDGKTIALTGTITLNGAAPSTGGYCPNYPTSEYKARVIFTDSAQGHSVEARVLCGSASYTFDVVLVPGTYEVRVIGRSSPETNLPLAS